MVAVNSPSLQVKDKKHSAGKCSGPRSLGVAGVHLVSLSLLLVDVVLRGGAELYL